MQGIWPKRLYILVWALSFMMPLAYAHISPIDVSASSESKAIAQNQKKLAKLKKHYRQQLAEREAQEKLLAQLIQSTYTEQQYTPLKMLLTPSDTASLARRQQYAHYFYEARARSITALQENLTETEHLRVDTEKELNRLCRALQPKLSEVPNLSEGISSFAKMKRQLPWPLTKFQKIDWASSKKSASGSKNIYFPAKEGTPVTAIFNGKVVFSEFLRGFGLLVIIDHGQGYMSLYGNNQKLYKSLGDSVSQGEMIAQVGQSGAEAEGGLYFEIRKDGESLDPSLWFKSS